MSIYLIRRRANETGRWSELTMRTLFACALVLFSVTSVAAENLRLYLCELALRHHPCDVRPIVELDSARALSHWVGLGAGGSGVRGYGSA